MADLYNNHAVISAALSLMLEEQRLMYVKTMQYGGSDLAVACLICAHTVPQTWQTSQYVCFCTACLSKAMLVVSPPT